MKRFVWIIAIIIALMYCNNESEVGEGFDFDGFLDVSLMLDNKEGVMIFSNDNNVYYYRDYVNVYDVGKWDISSSYLLIWGFTNTLALKYNNSFTYMSNDDMHAYFRCGDYNLTLSLITNTNLYEKTTIPCEIYFNKGFEGDSQRVLNRLTNLILSARASISAHLYDIDDSSVVNAFKEAADNGVKIRLITDADNINSYCFELDSHTNIQVIADNKMLSASNTNTTGNSHNKFIVFDYNYNGESDVRNIVWTGSLNTTYNGFYINYNNVIVIRDYNLADIYISEFNEMWGGTNFTFNSNDSKFRTKKTDNQDTHIISIGRTNNVEVYFSPSDKVKDKITSAISKARSSIYFLAFSFTSTDVIDAMSSVMIITTNYTTNESSIITNISTNHITIKGVFHNRSDESKNSIIAFTNNGISLTNFRVFDSGSAILHHKVIIIDPDIPENATLITGSCNFTTSGFEVNDENIIIVHDPAIANYYLYEFWDVWDISRDARSVYTDL